jgi:hypothetical protein
VREEEKLEVKKLGHIWTPQVCQGLGNHIFHPTLTYPAVHSLKKKERQRKGRKGRDTRKNVA